MLGLVNNSMAEMASYMPVSGGFIRMAGHWVDESVGFWVGWNFFLYEAFLIPFEISALNLVLTYCCRCSLHRLVLVSIVPSANTLIVYLTPTAVVSTLLW
jgi:amino acid permease